jgi:hypothetical protein
MFDTDIFYYTSTNLSDRTATEHFPNLPAEWGVLGFHLIHIVIKIKNKRKPRIFSTFQWH